MQLLPHGDLGKGIVGTNAPDGFHVPSSGVGRVLLAFGIIATLVLLLDAVPSKSAAPVTGFTTQQGSVG